MKQIIVLPSFERSLKRLDHSLRSNVVEALSKFNDFACSGDLPHGLGFKKLVQQIYEIRVNIKIRILIQEDSDAYCLVFVGSHDDVKKFLAAR